MSTERTVPLLPCRDLDDVLPFYQALGFEQTFRQARPNPYLCLNRGALDLHFFAVQGFEPENSLGSILVLVADAGALYDAFAAGLRDTYGKLPVTGIPRITRPRRKQGAAGGFTVVDPGGNWLRIASTSGEQAGPAGRLDRVMLNAARQGDARGDEAAAISVLEAGLIRHSDAPAAERLPALVYLAELLARSGSPDKAAAVLAEIRSLPVEDPETVAGELAAAAELQQGL